jgi:hypothetical protein
MRLYASRASLQACKPQWALLGNRHAPLPAAQHVRNLGFAVSSHTTQGPVSSMNRLDGIERCPAFT